MFLRLSRQAFSNFQFRKYWTPPTIPTHDIVDVIRECQKWQLSFLVKKNYNNHFNGSTIFMDAKQLLACSRFSQVKKDMEAEKFSIIITKDRTIGANTFGVKYDDFNKKLDIFV